MQKVLVLEINEVNFDLLEKYAAEGKLPNFKKFFDQYGYTKTHSESDQGVLNPWVQWITGHTGLNYEQHQVRRLGDMQGKSHEQIWERIERMGKSVGVFIAFNAKNNLKNPTFFLGDPWSREKRILPKTAEWADDALKQITDDYANGRIAPSSILKLIGSSIANLRAKNYLRLASYTKGYLSRKFYRALACDLLLSDIFLKMYKKSRPDFATCFINGAAHVQHHYMFSSKYYDGEIKNPEWFYKPGIDPLEEVYKLYDYTLGEIQKEVGSDTRLMLMTALSQEAHDRLSIYYRLKDHTQHLDELGVPYTDIQPLMTEDFIVRFKNINEAKRGQKIFESVRTKLDKNIFYTTTADDNSRENDTNDRAYYVDNRNDGSLYIQLKPSSDKYPDNFSLYVGDEQQEITGFENQVDFVSIKNAGHNEAGYFADSGYSKGELPSDIYLNQIPGHIAAIFGEKNASELKDADIHHTEEEAEAPAPVAA
ncbi:MAG: Unknown protein [uncultured Thiotrichaceae bacterium]|uniref:Uncharacterized protein n=1 Tax=uncultured Thiotrichaceae bacterium TaxID=298394 RepID=A0A6S6SHM9_9GAMM|nr:MAG: Unknown protein [uncultured Thiotrichaceae bacterium]